MKASTVIAVAAGLTAYTVSAQLDQLPTCALTCALSSLGSTGCAQTDIACICGADAFVASLIPCVQGGCTPAELETTIQAASALCASAGVTLSVPPIGGSSSTSAPSSSASATETVVSTTTEVTEPTVEPPVTNSTTTVEEPVPEPTSGSNTTSLTPPEPSGTDGSSASRNAAALGGLGALAAFVAALL